MHFRHPLCPSLPDDYNFTDSWSSHPLLIYPSILSLSLSLPIPYPPSFSVISSTSLLLSSASSREITPKLTSLLHDWPSSQAQQIQASLSCLSPAPMSETAVSVLILGWSLAISQSISKAWGFNLCNILLISPCAILPCYFPLLPTAVTGDQDLITF